MTFIHPTAIIGEGAVIGDDCNIGAYAVIGPKVVLGRNNRIGPHVVIEGRTILGNDNLIFQFASIGAAPQDLKYKGEDSQLIIGNSNIIREYVTLQPGTAGGGMLTSIGDGNLFMANCHAGHDTCIGSFNVFANSAALAGHVSVGSWVTVGGMCGVHQFVRLGDVCLLGAGSMVTKDVPPYCIAQGDRAGLAGLNVIGLKRRGLGSDEIANLKKVYREIFGGTGSFSLRLEGARKLAGSSEAAVSMLDFIALTKRGITQPRSKHKTGAEQVLE